MHASVLDCKDEDIINKIKQHCKKDIEFVQNTLNAKNRKNFKSVSQVHSIYKHTHLEVDINLLKLLTTVKLDEKGGTQLNLLSPILQDLDIEMELTRKAYLKVYANQFKRSLSKKIESYQDVSTNCTLNANTDKYDCYY